MSNLFQISSFVISPFVVYVIPNIGILYVGKFDRKYFRIGIFSIITHVHLLNYSKRCM